jgi:D-threonine aldolase
LSKPSWYEVNDTSHLLSPCLLVYPDIIRRNIAASIAIVGSPDRLRPHVKTHKTAEIVKMGLEQGVTKHKCATLFEAAMLAECGVPDVMVAYPLVGPAIRKMAHLIEQFPGTQFRCVVDNDTVLTQLSDEFGRRKLMVDVLLDLDTGMHRTGIVPGDAAIALYTRLTEMPHLTAGGFHVYDGQNHQPDLTERQRAVTDLLKPVRDMIAALALRGIRVPRLVCGGTPTFPVFASLDDDNIECSPGTCLLSDFNYGRDYADITGISHAAVLFSRVISRCGANRLTLDLGYKAVAADQPAGRRCHILNIPDAKEVGHSEEHLVIETAHADQFQPGDAVYALPSHVCPTVALHSHLQVVQEGQLVDSWLVTARDRFYRV